jgi:hypothetical protein
LEEGEGDENMASNTLVLSEWKNYKRYSDSVNLEARLVNLKGKKMMQVREKKGEDFVCPCCAALLSKGNGKLVPQFVLEPAVFHQRHRPLDKD